MDNMGYRNLVKKRFKNIKMKSKNEPKVSRRKVFKTLGLGIGAVFLPTSVKASEPKLPESKSNKVLTIAHITDVHIRPEHNAPNRFRKCLSEIKKHRVDFFLNGGDTIYAADYKDIKRNRVVVQWNIWNELRSEISEFDIYSCLGNHDMWWAAPDKSDEMYGKDYVVKQLKIPNRYYSFDKKGWHFIVLDSNNEDAGSLDNEQRLWLERDLEKLENGSNVLIMSHYPILGVSTILDGGNHTDSEYITSLFYKHSDKKISCLSGHVHLLDKATYNNVDYYCNGALSGYWWEEGDDKSVGKYWYKETPPGYAIIKLFDNGAVENVYYPHPF